MSNATKRNASLISILRTRAFGAGFRSYRAGEPLDTDRYRGITDQWNYERGRMLAAFYRGALRSDRRVARAAVIAANEAVYSGALI